MAWGALRSALSRAPSEVRVLAGIGLGLGVSTGIVGAYWFTLPDEVDEMAGDAKRAAQAAEDAR